MTATAPGPSSSRLLVAARLLDELSALQSAGAREVLLELRCAVGARDDRLARARQEVLDRWARLTRSDRDSESPFEVRRASLRSRVLVRTAERRCPESGAGGQQRSPRGDDGGSASKEFVHQSTPLQSVGVLDFQDVPAPGPGQRRAGLCEPW